MDKPTEKVKVSEKEYTLSLEEIKIIIQICNSIQVRVDQAAQVLTIIQKLQNMLKAPITMDIDKN